MSTPVVDITEAVGQRLDILRSVRLGADAQVDLLKPHADRGWEVLASYTDRWLLTQGDARNPDQIEIADVESSRRADLLKARAFGIPALSAVYVLLENGRHAPADLNRRVWLFYVDTSGESYAASE